MHSQHDDDRTSRKPTKSENRVCRFFNRIQVTTLTLKFQLFHFLRRSRSRSRSKDSELASESLVASTSLQPPLPRPRTPSKSPILPSRPLSSTPTTASSTAGPPTPKPHRHQPSSIPVRSPKQMPQALPPQHYPEPNSRPTTPKSASTTRRKLHTLFGIHLSSKSSSNSRPNSPTPNNPSHISLPPKRSEGKRRTLSDPDDPAPKLWTARIPTPPSHTPRTQSPRPPETKHSPPKTESDLSASTLSSAPSASRHDHRFSKATSGSGIRVSHPRPKTSGGPTGSDPGHSPWPSSSHGSPPAYHSHLPQNSASSGAPTSTITRVRTSSLSKDVPPSIPAGTVSPRISRRKDSVDSSHRYRPMTIVNEEKDSDDPVVDSATSTSRPRDMTASRAPKTESHLQSKIKRTSATRDTKHGSFDFERPGWATGIARSASHGSGSTGVSTSHGRNPSRESLGRSLQKSLSIGGKGPDRQKETPRSNVKRPPTTGEPKASTSHQRSTSDGQTSTTLGRSTVKRGFGSGIARLVGLHGPFAFEPAVPSSPTRLQASTRSPDSREATSEREQRRERRDREKAREQERAREMERVRILEAEKEKERREKERRRAGRRSAQVFEPLQANRAPSPIQPHRPGNKGRSLDLGLGLAWAPKKIKEDALIPSAFTLEKGFGPPRKSTVTRDADPPVDRSVVGREVADIFRNALNEDGYMAFKKCRF